MKSKLYHNTVIVQKKNNTAIYFYTQFYFIIPKKVKIESFLP